jgi:glycosyltransferase involved in cell wall biosynthesis
VRILLYNVGLGDSSGGGGTQKLLVERAHDISSHNPEAIITLCGNKVISVAHIGERILTSPLPLYEQRQAFIDLFDTVVFFSTVEGLEHTTKKPGHYWILDLHLWDIQETEISFAPQVDLICTRSELHQQRTEERLTSATPVRYVYNDIDLDIFKPTSGALRKPNSILYSGAIVPHKGTEKALQAFVFLQQHIPDLTMDIYGSAGMWNHEDHFEKELRRLVGGVAAFHGAVPREEMPRIFSEHSILVLPSELESFSLVSIEAQACGCIPIIHRCGGVAVTMIDQVTGFMYSPNTFDQLAQTIARALPRVDSMRDAARGFVAQKFDKAKNAARYAELVVQRTL